MDLDIAIVCYPHFTNVQFIYSSLMLSVLALGSCYSVAFSAIHSVSSFMNLIYIVHLCTLELAQYIQ